MSNIIIQSCSLKGVREQNEDQLDYINNLTSEDKTKKNYLCAGIFDGHGGKGVSNLLVNNINILDYIMSKVSNDISNKKDYNKYIIKTFKNIQDKLKNDNIKANNMGSTALISVIYEYKNNQNLKIINLGDCRAVICNKYFIGCPLTIDHKPNYWLEKMRITKEGGKIEYHINDDPRISGLSVSKSFGDLDCKYISQKPDIFDYKLNNDKFIILGCDGIWDVLSCQEAVDFVIENILKDKNLQNKGDKSKNNNIAYNLAEHALNKGSQDNLSIIIIFFKDFLSEFF